MAEDGVQNDTPEDGDEAPETALIPLSALQHAVYCLRQAALIHLEGLWAENEFTAAGQVLHQRVDIPGQRRVRGVRRVRALNIAAPALGIAGVADVVEFHTQGDGTERAYPLEFKRGKPKLHRADEVQLCAQGLCLEAMTGQPVPRGALYYGLTKRRVEVDFDAGLRDLTLATIAQLAEVFRSQQTPPAVYQARRCRACSLLELCRPKLNGKSARAWRQRMVQQALSTTPDDALNTE